MIDPEDFLQTFLELDVKFFAGVPDSLLKDICSCFSKFLNEREHIIACNEGAAVSLGIGHYLATSRPALIYLQNSGLGNTINPLISLSHKEVYSIPLILLIGWRGEILDDKSQLEDEPQHRAQGKITCKQLELMGIDYFVLDSKNNDYKKLINKYLVKSINNSVPFAIVVRKNCFKKNKKVNSKNRSKKLLSREKIIKIIIKSIPNNTITVSTTGFTSRELFEIRKSEKMGHANDFLTIGGMGHTSQIAAGIAFAKPSQRILCIDGDGSLLMHSGSMAVNALCSNLVHIVINNGVHDSVGGQPTLAKNINLSELARSFGYGFSVTVDNENDLIKNLKDAFKVNISCFIEVKSESGARSDLGRPELSARIMKKMFMDELKRK